MARMSSKDETINENVIEYFPVDFSYTPVEGDWVGMKTGKLAKKSSNLTEDDPDIIGVVISVRRKIRVLNSGYWKTDKYDAMTNGATLFLANTAGAVVNNIENTTNFVKKCGTKVPLGIIVDIEPADQYQNLIGS